MNVKGRTGAMQRGDQIACFRAELELLESSKVLVLTPEQHARLEAHHRDCLAGLCLPVDNRSGDAGRRVSWGIRVSSILGSAALVAALVLFLHRIWGHLPFPGQVAVLAGVPLVLLAAAEWAARRSVDRLYVLLLGLAAGVTFFMGLNALGAELNLTPSPHAFLAWSLFALLVAHAYGLRLILAAGLVFFCLYTGALATLAGGSSWDAFGQRPRYLLPASLAVYLVPWFAYRTDPHDFRFVYRLCGAVLGLGALLAESMLVGRGWGPVPPEWTGVVCQLAGLILSAAVVFHGICLGRSGLVNAGSVAFVVLLYARLHAWWWHRLPQFLFFLLIGLTAIALALLFRRVRGNLGEAS